MNKTCSKCKLLQPTEMYAKNKASNDGLRPSCRSCDSITYKQYRKNNKQILSVRGKIYRDKHQKELLEYHQAWYEKNLKNKGVNSDNPEYYKHYRSVVNAKQKERLQTDLAFKMKRNIGRMMKNFFNKTRSTYNIVGCSQDIFQEWMKWQADIDGIDDYDSNTHIDHVIPCATYKLSDPIEQQWCFNWSNLRLCNATDNIIKGDKLDKDLIKKQEIRAMCFIIKNKNKLQTGEISWEFMIRAD